MNRTLKLIAVIPLFFGTASLAQRSMRADTLNLNSHIETFSKTKRTNGMYDLYTYDDGTKIKAEVKAGQVTAIKIIDTGNNPVTPQLLKSSGTNGRDCWLNIKRRNTESCIKVPCSLVGR